MIIRMKKRYYLLLPLLCCCFSTSAEVDKQTFVYSIKGSDTLRLDRYEDPASAGVKPCILFVFGGSFMRGARDAEEYAPFYEYFANRGYVVVAIDYRLGLKDVRRKIDMTQGRLKVFNAFVDSFEEAVSMAVEDLFEATRFVVARATEWRVDVRRISTCGSSAGAIAVLQGEYAICNRTAPASALPGGFRYAGVISFAGGIFSHGEMKWQTPPAPILFFHGDADRNVPYDKIKFLRFGLYGPKQITAQLREMQSPYCFHSFDGAAHEISTRPMHRDLAAIETFLDRFADGKARLFVHTTETVVGQPPLKKKIKLKDCLNANFDF
jgi:dienelactone hydrolase